MRFVGIDPSTKTGFVALDEDGTVIKQKELSGLGKEDPRRIVTMVDEIMCHVRPRDFIVIESPGFDTQRAVQAGWIHGSIRNELYRRGFSANKAYMEVAPNAVKKFVNVTGFIGEVGNKKRLKGSEKKKAVAEAVLEHFGFSHPSDNVVDAYIMAQIARYIWKLQNNKPFAELAKYQLEVIEAILNPKLKEKKKRKKAKV